MRFYLGTHQPQWLADDRFSSVPLFVSRRTLAQRRALPRAVTRWALDSGGFTELSMFGAWQTTPEQYVVEARRFRDEIGRLDWCAPQDWMCEPWILQKTGLAVEEHQRRTVDNLEHLRDLAPDMNWRPVLQGWRRPDYLAHLDAYRARGIDGPFGVGTMCRRQGTDEARGIVYSLKCEGATLHLFGFKMEGLIRCADLLDDDDSADSLAWSFSARRQPPIAGHDKPGPGRVKGHINCANCAEFALNWRTELLARMERKLAPSAQGDLFSHCPRCGFGAAA